MSVVKIRWSVGARAASKTKRDTVSGSGTTSERGTKSTQAKCRPQQCWRVSNCGRQCHCSLTLTTEQLKHTQSLGQFSSWQNRGTGRQQQQQQQPICGPPLYCISVYSLTVSSNASSYGIHLHRGDSSTSHDGKMNGKVQSSTASSHPRLPLLISKVMMLEQRQN